MIEHMGIREARVLMAEAFRVLLPGGRVRLVTPNIRRMAEIYLGDPQDAERHLTVARQAGYEMHHSVDILRTVFHEGGHHLGYLWDFQALSEELECAGFVHLRQWDSGVSDEPALSNLENRGSREYAEVMLVVEATKPHAPDGREVLSI